jgi:hypothetical protein
MGEARSTGYLKALHHGGALPAIDVRSMHGHALVGRVEGSQRRSRRLTAPIVDDKNGEPSLAKVAHDLSDHAGMVEAGNDDAAVEGHLERQKGPNPTCPNEQSPSASVYLN